MEPHIQYTKTSDGISVAYWTMGEGPLLVLCPPGPVGHIAGELAVSDIAAWYKRLAQSFTILRYDPRGSGSSSRDNADPSHDARVRDLEAAVLTQETPVSVLAGLQWAMAAIEMAARRPEIVSHLVLWNPQGKWDDQRVSERLAATRTLIDKNWRAYTDAWAQAGFGWSRADHAREWARWYREATTPEYVLRVLELNAGVDVYGLLSSVQAPTLIVGHHFGQFVHPEAAKRIAAGIPNSRLVVPDGPQLTPAMAPDSLEENAALVEEFLGAAPRTESGSDATTPLPAGTAIILFADIADSTALTERLGDAAFRDKARDLDDALRRAITSNGGTAIDGKLLGDGVLATFGAAREAIACASAIHAGARAMGQGPSQDEALLLHVGIHAGDVIREDDNVYGGAVNIAARVASEAAAGETLVSATVRELARTSAGVSFEDRGERGLKGVGEPVRVFAVRSES